MTTVETFVTSYHNGEFNHKRWTSIFLGWNTYTDQICYQLVFHQHSNIRMTPETVTAGTSARFRIKSWTGIRLRNRWTFTRPCEEENFEFRLSKQELLFTKTYDPIQYFNWNSKLPKLQPNITINLPFPDDYVAIKLQDGASNEDCLQNLQLNLPWIPYQHLAAKNNLHDSNKGYYQILKFLTR